MITTMDVVLKENRILLRHVYLINKMLIKH